MKTLKLISILLIAIFLSVSCSQTKEIRKNEREESRIDNTIEHQAKVLTKKFESENYEICGLADMETEIYNYLKCKLKPNNISEEAIVVAPTDNLGKSKCLSNIKTRVAKIVCDSIRYRVDEATGGDEEDQDYVDKFFSASEHLGIINLGSPDYYFYIKKKINRIRTEYKMFAVYSGESVNNVVSNGVKFGNDIKKYIDDGFKK